MELIRKLLMVEDAKGKRRRRALFKCPKCNKEINMRLDHGKKADTCKPCMNNKGGTTHGKSNTRLYTIWEGIKYRCYRIPESNSNYPYYRGKGIEMYKDWKDNFQSFYDWATSNGYTPNLTIDRLDGNEDYTPSNCKWSTCSEQSVNTTKRLNCSSIYKGISYSKRGKVWVVEISYEGKRIYIGRRKDEIEAAKLRDDYIILHNLPHKLNF